MLKSSVFWLNLILAAAIALSLPLFFVSSPTFPKRNINAFMQNVRYISYNDEGSEEMNVSASSVNHTIDNQAIFKQPDIVNYSQDKSPWHIQADHATSQNGMDEIKLAGNVKIYQLAVNNKPTTTILTPELLYKSKSQKASTESKVTIIRDNSTIQGKGLTANLAKGIYQLKSQTDIHYNGQESQHKQDSKQTKQEIF